MTKPARLIRPLLAFAASLALLGAVVTASPGVVSPATEGARAYSYSARSAEPDQAAAEAFAARRGPEGSGGGRTSVISAHSVPSPLPPLVDVPNSMRGQYHWLGIDSAIPDLAARDVYWRDQLQWRALEPTPGTYDFSSFERGLVEAQQRGGRFSFRIMAFCPGCGDNLTPAYVPRADDGAPDWNSELFLSSWENLMRELGRRFGDDPRLSMLDIGGYGWWGEWYVPEGTPNRITDGNARRMMSAVVSAFPRKFVLASFMDPYPAMAVELSDKVGFRFDCIGGFDMTLAYLPERMRDIWRRSPVVGEWCPMPETSASTGVRNVRALHLSTLSSGNYPRSFAQMSSSERVDYRRAYVDSGYRYQPGGAEARRDSDGRWRLRITWQNPGVAPTYDAWTPRVRLTDLLGRTLWEGPVRVDLRTVTADSGVVTSSTDALPRGLRGNVGVSVRVDDEAGYLSPMTLPLPGRDAAGAYPLGRLLLAGT